MKIATNVRTPPAWLDDSERDRVRNGKPALGSLVSREAQLLNQISYAGHPAFTFISDGFDQTLLRQAFFPANLAATTEGLLALYRHGDTGGSPQPDQGIKTTFNGTDTVFPVSFVGLGVTTTWPTTSLASLVTTDNGRQSSPVEVKIASNTTNGPFLHGGTYMQAPVDFADTASGTGAMIGTSDLAASGNIVGTAANTSIESLDRFKTSFIDAVRFQRPQFGWSTTDNTTVNFSTSKNQYRYIFDQSFGTGGTAFSGTGPAMTLPLINAAVGRRTQVRVYVFVYASMSGTTDTGSIAIANKDASGSMASSATTITNGPTISGTSFAWYPTLASWDASTSPYFLGFAGGAFDRVAFCAKSSGTTDSVHIKAFTLIPMHLD